MWCQGATPLPGEAWEGLREFTELLGSDRGRVQGAPSFQWAIFSKGLRGSLPAHTCHCIPAAEDWSSGRAGREGQSILLEAVG